MASTAASTNSPANKSVFAKVKHAGVKAKAFDAEGNEVEVGAKMRGREAERS